jgi:5'-3' exonuclease
MGVPFFFGSLHRRYGDIVVKALGYVVALLCIDANGLIHPVCQKVMEEFDPKKIETLEQLEQLMYLEICSAILEKVKLTNCKAVHIAIDGVPPFAKAQQQRIRRFKSLSDKKLKQQVEQRWGLKIVDRPLGWDSTAISPGTNFMNNLTIYIETRISEGYFGDAKVIFSSADTPGEGEHKLLHYIRKQKFAKDEAVAVDGLDADLLFLSLASEKQRIFLLRQESQIGNSESDATVYVSIDRLRQHVINMMRKSITNSEIDADEEKKDASRDDIELVRDWIVICYMLGNDFLPHFPFLTVKEEGLERLVTSYGKVNRQIVYCDSNTGLWSLDIAAVSLLAQELAFYEGDLEKHSTRRYSAHYKYRSFDEEWRAVEQLRFPIKDRVRIGQGRDIEWKRRYYAHHLQLDYDGRPESLQISNDDSANMCNEYVKGLIWVANYYFGKCISWTWYYPYGSYGPFPSDLYRLKLQQEFKFTLDWPVKPAVLLLIILPRESSHLIPKKYRHLIEDPDSPIGDLYPLECEQAFPGNKLWQGIPYLPRFDPFRVIEALTAK